MHNPRGRRNRRDQDPVVMDHSGHKMKNVTGQDIEDQMDDLREYLIDNFRPLQALHGRKVLKSFDSKPYEYKGMPLRKSIEVSPFITTVLYDDHTLIAKNCLTHLVQ